MRRRPNRAASRSAASAIALWLVAGTTAAGQQSPASVPEGAREIISVPVAPPEVALEVIQEVTVERLRGLRATAAALLVDGRDGGALPLAAILLSRPEDSGSGGRNELTVVAELDLSPFAALIGRANAGDALASDSVLEPIVLEPTPEPTVPEPTVLEPLTLEVYAYALDTNGAVLGHLEVVARLPPNVIARRLDDGGLRFFATVALGASAADAPVPERLRLLVLEPLGRRHGLISLSLVGPAATEGPAPPPRAAARDSLHFDLEDDSTPPEIVALLRASRAPAAGTATGPTTGGTTTGHTEARIEPPSRAPRDSYGEQYRGVLATLVDGDLATARDQLLDLQEAARAEERDGRLLEAEIRTAQELVSSARGGGSTEPWVPLVALIGLHRAALGAAVVRGLSTVATFNLHVIESLATLGARTESDPEGRRLLADTLTVLAVECERLRLSTQSRQLLERALTLDPGHAAAGEMLALFLERDGDLLRAADVLEALLELTPDNRELRLRRAQIALKQKRLGTATSLTRALIAERRTDWVQDVAFQLQARIELDSAAWPEAVQLLQRAVTELPESQSLQILLAFALDRGGEPEQGLAVLDALSRRPAPGPSPRLRYAQLGAPALAASEERLAVVRPLLNRGLATALRRDGSAR